MEMIRISKSADASSIICPPRMAWFKAGATRPIFGTSVAAASTVLHRAILTAACCRMRSSRKSRFGWDFISLGRRAPSTFRLLAFKNTQGFATSMQVACTPSKMSDRLPVGSSAPVLEPAGSIKDSSIGEPVPATPSMANEPDAVA